MRVDDGMIARCCSFVMGEYANTCDTIRIASAATAPANVRVFITVKNGSVRDPDSECKNTPRTDENDVVSTHADYPHGHTLSTLRTGLVLYPRCIVLIATIPEDSARKAFLNARHSCHRPLV